MRQEAWGRKVDGWFSAYGRREQWGDGSWKLEGKLDEGGLDGKKTGRMGSWV
jgi:hypothetical protein